jgi:integrase
LSNYLVSRGLHADPAAAENRGAFLLGKALDANERAPWAGKIRRDIDPKEGIAHGTLYDQMKAFFAACAAQLEKTDAAGGQGLAAASAHWLRHTHGNHSAALGTPLEVLQQNLGHASLHTTAVYARTDKRKRAKPIESSWDGEPQIRTADPTES